MKINKIYSISIILPILNEINSLKKTIKILNKINVKKEFLIIYSNELTNNNVKREIFNLKKNINIYIPNHNRDLLLVVPLI